MIIILLTQSGKFMALKNVLKYNVGRIVCNFVLNGTIIE